MNKRITFDYRVVLILADILLAPLALHLARLVRLWLPYGQKLEPRHVQLNPSIYVLVLLIWAIVFPFASTYDPSRVLRLKDQVWSACIAAGASTLVFGGTLYLTFRDVSRLLFVYFFIIDVAILILVRLLLRFLWSHGTRPAERGSKLLVVGAGELGRRIVRGAADYHWAGLHLEGFLDDDPAKQGRQLEGVPVLGTLDDAIAVIQERAIGEVIVALPKRAFHKTGELVFSLQQLPVRVRVVPDVLSLALFRATIEDFHGVPLIGLRDPVIDGYDRLVKRVFDIIFSTVLLVLSLPLMCLVALAIRLDTPGRALFKQTRVGENGVQFGMYKFRTMTAGSEREWPAAPSSSQEEINHKRPDDPRVTKVGKLLRRASIDELPQLVNVLKGEMSLVGPRPELPQLVECYENWQLQRFAVPPGMTGWWQVNGRSERAMHLHTEDDLYYIRNYSLLLDLRILWRTVGVVLRGRGAF